MTQEINYSLVIEIEGQYESQAAEGLKGSGEGLKQLEKEIRQMNFAASNTNIRVKSLTKI